MHSTRGCREATTRDDTEKETTMQRRTTRPITDPTGDTTLWIAAQTVITCQETPEGLTGTQGGWVFPLDDDETEDATPPQPWCEVCEQDASPTTILVAWHGIPVCTDCLAHKAEMDAADATEDADEGDTPCNA
jgi:hypothetical protein